MQAAQRLDSGHALLAQVLRVLGQDSAQEAIGMPARLLERVISAVDAERLASHSRAPWLYFYEDFLAAYDAVQRNNRGVYYTPFPVVCVPGAPGRVRTARQARPARGVR